jgi:hypothetical protein
MDQVLSHPSAPGRVYLGINALFIILVTSLVGLRFWARRLKRTFFGWDDWCILVALLIFYGQASFNIWVVYHGALGYHTAQAGESGVRNMLLQLREPIHLCHTVLHDTPQHLYVVEEDLRPTLASEDR